MTILCYHAVEPDWASPLAITPAGFAAQMRWLVRHRRIVPLDAAVSTLGGSGLLPRGTTAITFDDGFAGVFRHALPILSSLGVAATVFLVAGTLDEPPQPVDWTNSQPPPTIRTVTRDEILEMQDAGVTFGSHGFTHRDLTSLGGDGCLRDLRESRSLLEDVLRRPVTLLAYPFGRHDGMVRRAAKRAGFSHAFGLPAVSEPTGRYSIPRVGIYAGNGRVALRIKVSGGWLPLRTSKVYPLLRRLS